MGASWTAALTAAPNGRKAQDDGTQVSLADPPLEAASPTRESGSGPRGDADLVLYVVGGQQQSLRPLSAGTQSWYRYAKGVVLRVEPARGTVETVYEYVSPPEVHPEENPAILFKSATLAGDAMYLCTQTEVMVCRLPDFALQHYISLRHFHDVHHTLPTPRGTLLVANTGLDMVLEVTLEGKVVGEWGVCEPDPWTRFSRSVDYRVVPSTKPHRAHPNHLFLLGSEVWVTRFEQRDAICLTEPGKRIHIGLERMHDGFVHGAWIFFTTVDGKVAVVSRDTLRVEEVIDLNEISTHGMHLGWCRSIFVDGEKLWVGFSRLRPTKFRENVSWVRKGFRREMPTHVACYDMARRVCVATIELEDHGLNAVFSVLPHVGTGPGASGSRGG